MKLSFHSSTTALSLLLLLLAADENGSDAFSPVSMQSRRSKDASAFVSSSSTPRSRARSSPLFLWVDHFSTPPGSSTSLEFRVKDCLTKGSCNVEHMTMLVNELEALQHECTEEGNQTKDECDIVKKETRDVWIKALEEKISSVAASTMVMFLSSSSSKGLEEQVKSCLTSSTVLSLQELKALLSKLEAKHYECTEEGNQMNPECDLVVKEERESIIKRLEAQIQNLSLDQVEASLKSSDQPGLSELTHLMAVLEHQTCLCTEEGHQTAEWCDLEAKERRQDLMAAIDDGITTSQSQTAQKTRDCLTYQLCDTRALQKTLLDLEELSNLCTEEGNQTRSFCSLQAKEEREDIMDKIRYQLDLAETVMMREAVFQI